MDWTMIWLLATAFALAFGALGLLFWLAHRPTDQERERAAARQDFLTKLHQAEKDFGNPWGGHG